MWFCGFCLCYTLAESHCLFFYYIKFLSLIFLSLFLVTMRLLSTLRSAVLQLNYSIGHEISLVHMNKSVMYKNELELLRINIDEEYYILFKEVVELLFVKMNTQRARSSF